MQLELLSWRPPVQVIPFPAAKRVGHIRRMAERIRYSRTQREADNFWQRGVTGLVNQMTKAGVPQDRIDAEVSAFRAAVSAEMDRLMHQPRQPDGELA